MARRAQYEPASQAPMFSNRVIGIESPEPSRRDSVVPLSGSRPAVGPAQPPGKSTWWKRAAFAALTMVALAQAGIIGWWLRTGTMPWVLAQPSEVVVTSDPAGAPVTIDGVRMGAAPVTVSLPAGTHKVVVGEGEAAQTQTIEARPGAGTAVHFALAMVPPAPPAATTGELVITTEPPGADVAVDGTSHGASPVTVWDLAPGSHQVTVTRGATTIQRTVDVFAGTLASVIVTLPAEGIASGWLTVSSPVVADIFEHDALVGRTNTPRLLLPVGRHDLDIVNDTFGYRTRRTVQIAGGRTVNLQLEPVHGVLSVNAQPWAEVWIDDERAGETPLGNLTLPIGLHDVLLRHPQLGERRQTVAIGATTPARVGVDLRP